MIKNLYFILGIAAALFAMYIVYIVKRAVISARIKRGLKAEKEAVDFLSERGYKIEGYQQEFEYSFIADGEEVNVKLRPDYIVRKRSKRYIAEVKCGNYVSSLYSRETRRQLMEYYFNIDVDGILLVDMLNRNIIEVEFKSRIRLEKEAAERFIKVTLTVSIILNIILIVVIKNML